MKTQTKILLLGSQHGDEYSGERLHEYMKIHHPELLDNIAFVVGNPRARKQKKRYTESDMNRSYSGSKDTYEQRRAVKILKHIDEGKFDLVLDMHTTTVNQPHCLILAAIGPENVRFLQASSFENIVVLNNPIVNNSINGNRANAVSVEVFKDISDELLELLCLDIKRYLQGQASNNQKYVYEVTQLLEKSEIAEADALKLKNFELSEHGYYPIMVGENSYQSFTNYLGFKAYKRYIFK